MRIFSAVGTLTNRYEPDGVIKPINLTILAAKFILEQIELSFRDYSEAEFSHSLCEEYSEKLHGDFETDNF